MFVRAHRIGKHLYTEALESYRDPCTGRPKHRCVARWRAEHTLAEELGRIRVDIALSSANCAYFQGVLDRTVPPNRREHIKGASDYLSYWQRKYRVAASHLAALMKARESLPTDDAEIERAQEAETKRRGAFRSVMRPVESFPSSSLEQLGTLADQVRGLASLNDPDAVRTGLAEVAAALDALMEMRGT
jgi:hypothetical protein